MHIKVIVFSLRNCMVELHLHVSIYKAYYSKVTFQVLQRQGQNLYSNLLFIIKVATSAFITTSNMK